MRDVSLPHVFSPVFFRSSRNVWLVHDCAALSLSEHGNDFDKGWTWHRQAKTARRRNNVKSRGSARNYPNTTRRRILVYTCSLILSCMRERAAAFTFSRWKERNFLKETRVRNYTRANASNKIVLFSSEISNISPPIFVTEYTFV